VHAVVVGSGIAGLITALHAVRTGVAVTLVTKDVLDNANTHYAQGGIAAVMFDEDSPESHVADTLTAGAGMCDEEAVRVLVAEGPDRIRELIALGVGFDRTADGTLKQGLEGAHSFPRILHAGGDATGAAIEHALVDALRASGVEVIEHAFLVDLVVVGGRVSGVDLLVDDVDRRTLAADAVVLATGGAGRLFAWTTNPPVATGDGIAAAMRAGAAVGDLEFVQFHPTVLPGDDPFLVSEAVRGEGAVLVDEHRHRFVFDVHPAGELAPRDVVARAIANRVIAQDGRPVHLDATALGAPDTAAFLARRFPTIDAAVHARGLDWAHEPIPVTPAAHYLMGGVSVDLYGRTTLPGLYAVGEASRTGVHGANRLASNSLLEGAVFGARVGDVLAIDHRGGVPAPSGLPTGAAPVPPAATPALPEGAEPFSRAALQRLMWEHVGLLRDAAGLARAASVLAAWAAEPREPAGEAGFEDENLLLLARGVVAAAAARRHSVGAHFRTDDVPTETPEGAAC